MCILLNVSARGQTVAITSSQRNKLVSLLYPKLHYLSKYTITDHVLVIILLFCTACVYRTIRVRYILVYMYAYGMAIHTI